MLQETMMRWRRICDRILPLLTAFGVVVGLALAVPACSAETGIRGTVLMGPTMPGPERLGQDNTAPLGATFIVMSAEQAVARFASDDEGKFEVSLPPGDYTLVPDKNTPVHNARQQTTKVTVPADGFVTVTIMLDTGMQ